MLKWIYGNAGGLYFKVVFNDIYEKYEVFNEDGDLLFSDVSQHECLEYVERTANKESGRR